MDVVSSRAGPRALWAFRIARLSELAPLFANRVARVGRFAFPGSAVRFDCLFFDALVAEPLAGASKNGVSDDVCRANSVFLPQRVANQNGSIKVLRFNGSLCTFHADFSSSFLPLLRA